MQIKMDPTIKKNGQNTNRAAPDTIWPNKAANQRKDAITFEQVAAYKEMLAYDFYTSGGHEGFKTYVDNYYHRMTSDPSSVPVAYHPVHELLTSRS